MIISEYLTTFKEANHWSGAQVNINGVEKIKRSQSIGWVIHTDIEVTQDDGRIGGEKDSSQQDA